MIFPAKTPKTKHNCNDDERNKTKTTTTTTTDIYTNKLNEIKALEQPGNRSGLSCSQRPRWVNTGVIVVAKIP